MKQFVPLCRRDILFLFLAILFVPSGFAQHLYTVESLPSPKEAGQDFYVSNPDAVLSTPTVRALNNLSTGIDKTSGVEYAIVVVNDFEGYDVFEFALKLFNRWGIGKHGQNNGLLLFVAKDRREYRFISGYGMEAIFPDVYLHRIGEKYLVPHFRAANYDNGVLEASQAIQQALMAPDVKAELRRMMPEATPFFSLRNVHLKNALLVIVLYVGLYYWVGGAGKKWVKNPVSKNRLRKQKKGCSGWFAYIILGGLGTVFTMLFIMLIFAFVINDMNRMFQISVLPYVLALWGSYVVMMKIFEVSDRIKKGYRDEKNRLDALRRFRYATFIPYLLSPLMLFSFFNGMRKWKNSRTRFVPPDDSGNWERINRDDVKVREVKAYLSEGQLKEEDIRSRSYEIWINRQTGEKKIIGWNGKKQFSVCPVCGFRTYEKGKKGKILKRATYSSSGLQEVYDHCLHCKHKEDKGTRIVPKKVRSSGGGSSGGSGSSGGGGGSFGGGSSGGGGAGGRW
ncbi:TPM domain-containing protein [Sphingobacterium gobiense]|uniref:TPM domain-containing protein n=1 Tax=Sphingobacterium gobiense TaxID=1382456 RepID=UPI0011B092B6|nr:TPM domain-containing protein [Sphingobacterium gobiense]